MEMYRHLCDRGTMLILSYLCFMLLITGGVALQCYKCHDALTNEECNQEDNLVDCDNEGSAAVTLDTCRTQVMKSRDRGITYMKECVKGPCSLGGDQGRAMDLDRDCDRTQDQYICEYCCEEDGCNTSTASHVTAMYGIATWGVLAVWALRGRY